MIKEPKLIEGDIFRIIIPIPKTTEQVTEQVTEQAILEFCRTPRTTKEIMELLHLKHREYVRSSIIKPLLEKGLLMMTIPGKPNSPK